MTLKKYLLAILLFCPLHWLLAANDGLDIDANQNLLIDDCFVSGGDDALCIKSCILSDNTPPPLTENNVTCNTVVYSIGYRAPQIGAESASNVQDVYYQDMHIISAGSSDIAIGYGSDTGGTYSNIQFLNFFGEASGNFNISSDYSTAGSFINGVTISNMYLNTASAITFTGALPGGISNVSLNNIWIQGALQSNMNKVTVSGTNVTNVTLGTTPISARITEPTEYAVLDNSYPIVLQAAALCTGSGLITKVDFYNGAAEIGESTASPYTCNWSTSTSGTCSLTAIAYDSNGHSQTTVAIPVTLCGTRVLNSITVSPGANISGPYVAIPYSAVAYDQYGNTLEPQPSFSWSVSGGGAITSGGVFSVGGSPGTYAVQAQASVSGITVTGSTTLQVTNTFTAYDLQENSDSTYAWGTLNNGSPIFCDTTSETSSNIPSAYQGLQLLQTAWGDYLDLYLFASFKISHPTRVFVAMDSKATNPGPWFTGVYATTGNSFVVGGDTYNIYYKDYPADSVILMGPKSETAAAGGRTPFIFLQPLSAIVTPPSAPMGLSASGSTGAVALSWTPSSTATTYNVLRSVTSGSGYTTIAAAVSGTSYADSTVANGTPYYYVVSASNYGGTSPNSPQAAATPSAAISGSETLPPAVAMTATSGSSANLAFTVASSVLGHTYQLQYTGNLVNASWVNIGSAQAGTGGALILNVTITPAAAPRGFYRIVIQRD